LTTRCACINELSTVALPELIAALVEGFSNRLHLTAALVPWGADALSAIRESATHDQTV